MINCLKYFGNKTKLAMHKFFTDEHGEVNVVAIVVLIAVAVVLALLFKEQIGTLIQNLLTQISGKAMTSLDDI